MARAATFAKHSVGGSMLMYSQRNALLNQLTSLGLQFKEHRVVFVPGEKMKQYLAFLGATRHDLVDLEHCCNFCSKDPTLLYRRSMTSRLALNLQEGEVRRLEKTGFVLDGKDGFNRHDTGKMRYFPEVPDCVVQNSGFRALIRFQAFMMQFAKASACVHCDAESIEWLTTAGFQSTTATKDQVGHCAEEGVHTDGAEYTMTTLMHTRNLRRDSATTRVYSVEQPCGVQCHETHSEFLRAQYQHRDFLDTLMLVDNEFVHSVNPIYQHDPDVDAKRDLVLFFTRRPAVVGAQSKPDSMTESHPHMPASWTLPMVHAPTLPATNRHLRHTRAPWYSANPSLVASPSLRSTCGSAREFSSNAFPSNAYQHFIPQWQSRESFNKSGVEVSRCSGVYLYDSTGRQVIDMMSQIMAVNLGHNLPIYKRAIIEQLESVPFLNTIKFVHPVLDRYTRELSHILPTNLNKIFFTVSGAEANEAAMKVARTVTGKSKVLYRNRSYHGASYGALSVSGDGRRDMLYGLDVPHAIQIPHPVDLEQEQVGGLELGNRYVEVVREVIEREGAESIAAMLVETMTGGSGMYPPPPGAMIGLRKLCDDHGILLISDEAITGFGRTGTMWAFEQEGFTPDILTLAKGITNGVAPLGAIVVADHVQAKFDMSPFPHGATNNSHLLSVAVAQATLDYLISNNVIANVVERETQLRSWLERLTMEGVIKSYRLRGLMGCIVCNPSQSRSVATGKNACYSSSHLDMLESIYQKGVYTLMREDLLFLGPPLTISETELEQAMSIMEEGIVESQNLP